MRTIGTAHVTISELREFAGFTACEQRFIRRSLDVALGRHDAFARWARNEGEAQAIHAQYVAYRDLAALRTDVDGPNFLGRLIDLTAGDLEQQRLTSFSAYRFLYERLLGAAARPWLPAAFCAAAALPRIAPERRKLLLRSISESAATAIGWSTREPVFFPEWVELEAA